MISIDSAISLMISFSMLVIAIVAISRNEKK